MLTRIRNLVLYLLLACLPLQSVAAPAHMLFCGDAMPAIADGLHVHDDGDGHPAHDGPADQGGTFAHHDCCQQYFPGVLHSSSPDAGETRIVYVPLAPAGFYSFFPEHLDRPPLTVLAV